MVNHDEFRGYGNDMEWLSVCYGIDGPWIWHQKSSRNHPSGSWPRSHLPSPPSTRETSGWSQWIRKMATESRGNDGKIGNLWKMGWKWDENGMKMGWKWDENGMKRDENGMKMGWKWDENGMKMGWKWDERWSKGKSIASWNTLLCIYIYNYIYILDYITVDAILLGSRESQTNQRKQTYAKHLPDGLIAIHPMGFRWWVVSLRSIHWYSKLMINLDHVHLVLWKINPYYYHIIILV